MSGISGVYLATGCLGLGILEFLDELDMEHNWTLLQQCRVSLILLYSGHGASFGCTEKAPGISGLYLAAGSLGLGVLECQDDLEMEPPWALLQQCRISLQYTWLQDALVQEYWSAWVCCS